MSISSYKGGNEFFESMISTIELAILQQDIILPELPDEPLSLNVLRRYEELGKTYKFADQEYKNMIGNFYIPVLFPLIENKESTELEFSAPDTKNIINDKFKTSKYVERNFISLMIPKYIVMNFRGKIPKGTKFLVSFIDGSTKISDINIIGLYGKDL